MLSGVDKVRSLGCRRGRGFRGWEGARGRDFQSNPNRQNRVSYNGTAGRAEVFWIIGYRMDSRNWTNLEGPKASLAWDASKEKSLLSSERKTSSRNIKSQLRATARVGDLWMRHIKPFSPSCPPLYETLGWIPPFPLVQSLKQNNLTPLSTTTLLAIVL